MTSTSAAAREYSSVDITSASFWQQPFADRDRVFAQLRAADGLTWHHPLSSLFPMDEDGFWALTRRADIAFVSQHPELFTSAQGVSLDPMPAEVQRFASFFLTMDPPDTHGVPAADQFGVHPPQRPADRTTDPRQRRRRRGRPHRSG